MGRPRKKRRNPAELAEGFVRSDADRAVPPCLHFGNCGGCSRQNLAYARQLEVKREQVVQALHAAGLEAIPVPTPLASPDLFRYRNRMEFSFGARRWLTEAEIASGAEFRRDFALGLHPPGFFGRVIDIGDCALIDGEANAVLTHVRAFAELSGLLPYDAVTHEGFWRYLSVRRGARTGETLVTIVTRARSAQTMRSLAAFLRDRLPFVTTVVNGVTDRIADTSEGASYIVDLGPGVITDRAAGLTFEISADSFFQPNTRAAETIFAEALRQAGAVADLRVVDLFCGTGTLGLAFAQTAREVHGYELNPASVACARRNAARNGLANARFDVLDLSTGRLELGGPPDVLVTDPPRAGMSEKLLDAILELAPPTIVSVGCNPESQARNLARLTAGGYSITALQPVDQFPHTPHIEVVATLRK